MGRDGDGDADGCGLILDRKIGLWYRSSTVPIRDIAVLCRRRNRRFVVVSDWGFCRI